MSNPFFRMIDEVGRDPRLPAGPKVFPNTRGLHLDPAERPWARWEGGTLGDSGVDLWRVSSTGHAIDLVGASRWSYHLPLRGGMTLTYGQTDRTVETGQGAVLGERRRRTHVHPASDGLFDGFVLLVDPRRAGLIAGHRRNEDTGLVTARDRGALASYLRFLVAELCSPASALHEPAALHAAGSLLVELYAGTAASAQGDGTGDADIGDARVRRAREMMRARFAEPLTIRDIAQEVGVGPRALQAAFAAHAGTSPRNALNEIRLDAARDALLSAGPADTVTQIALSCGFAHLGRFARAYAERFGEPPSETLGRLRRGHPRTRRMT